jgi:hypothetical protein
MNLVGDVEVRAERRDERKRKEYDERRRRLASSDGIGFHMHHLIAFS